MSSVRDRLLPRHKKPRNIAGGRGPRQSGARLEQVLLTWPRELSERLRRSRVSIQIWLTLLFLFVTAFAAGTAYSIIYPRLEAILVQSAEASFNQAFENLEDDIANNPQLDEQYINTYATTRGLSWGIVRLGDS